MANELFAGQTRLPNNRAGINLYHLANMPSTAPDIEFKPRENATLYGSIGALMGLFFVLAGLYIFHAAGLHPFSFAFSGLGLIGMTASIGFIFSRTVITPDGIKKRPRISGGFSLQWDQIESWSMINPQSDEARSVRFRLRRGWFPRVIYDYEVAQPGFEKFLAKVRQHARQKEVD